MTDLHSHILPQMDDGAPDVEASIKLLELEAIQDVTNVALTSHYNHAKISIDEFLERRQQSYRMLLDAVSERGMNINLKLGGEVMFFPHLINEPVYRLCLEDTDVLLLELPLDHNPSFIKETLDYLRADGMIPVIAHVERYPYIVNDPRILAEWVDMGVYAQINGSTLLQGGEISRFAMKLIKWNLVHVIATDAHSLTKRPPVIRQALRAVEKELGKKKADWLMENADRLFMGEEPEYRDPHMPIRLFNKWL